MKRKLKKQKKLPGFAYGLDGQQNQPFYAYDYNGILSPQYARQQFINQSYGGNGTQAIIDADRYNDIYGKPFHVQADETPGSSGTSSEGGLTADQGNAIAQAVQADAKFAWDIGDSFSGVKSVNQLVGESSRRQMNAGDFNYEHKDVNANRQIGALKHDIRKKTAMTTASGIAAGATTGLALGLTVGSIAPGIGTVAGAIIGGIGGALAGTFGGAHRKRKMQRRIFNAQQQINRINIANYAQNKSQWMDLSYAADHNYTQGGALYGAKYGKDSAMILPEFLRGKNNDTIYTAFGKMRGTANAKVAGGESIVDNLNDANNTVGTVVRDGKRGVDGPLANLKDSTVVFGGDINWETGMKFMDEAFPFTQALERINKKYESRTNKRVNELRGKMGQMSDEVQQREINKLKQPIVERLQDLADKQKLQHEYQKAMSAQAYSDGLMHAKGGKDRSTNKKDYSWLNAFIPNTIGMGVSAGQYFSAKDQDINRPSLYEANDFAPAALSRLASIRANSVPLLREADDKERQAYYATNRAGGLSGAQRYLSNAAIAANQAGVRADILSSEQAQNNEYSANYAKTAIATGEQDAQRKQTANQIEAESIAKAHAARHKMMEMGQRNFMDYITQYAASEDKRKRFKEMYNLYADQNAQEKEAIRAYTDYINSKKNKKTTAFPTRQQLVAQNKKSADAFLLGYERQMMNRPDVQSLGLPPASVADINRAEILKRLDELYR